MKKNYVIKKKEIEDAYQNLALQLGDLKNQSKPSTYEIKERIRNIKQSINENLNFDKNCISTEIIDSFVDKITVHKDKFEWKLNYLTELNDYIGDIPIEDKGIHLATIVINRDNYIGNSTNLEIEYAKKIGKEIIYYTDLIKEK